jgi:L-lactate dehydrogenase complex protein LldG
MSAREEVLQRVRAAMGPGLPSGQVARDYRVADATPPSVDLFVSRVEDYCAAVHRCAEPDVADLVRRLATGRVVVPTAFPEEWLVGVDVVRDEPVLSAVELDGVAGVLTTCALAIAETGTIVLDAGPGQGRRALSLVPDHHVVVVRADQLVATVPQAITRLDARRPQTWISGPSATSDIELQRVEGVHGPRRLDVVLVSAG